MRLSASFSPRMAFLASMLAACLCLNAQTIDDIVGGQKATGQRIRVATEGLANPERGYRSSIMIGRENGSSTESAWPFPDYKDDGMTLTQAYCYLSKYCDSDLPQSLLDALQKSFDRAREDGVKFVLRFAYLTSMEAKEGPTLERILSHMEQLKPLVRKNIDVIYVLESGWIGAWGEFHSDPHGLDRDSSAVAAVLGATLDMLPKSRCTLMRCMRYRTKAEQFAGPGKLDMNRVGFFNDGTLAQTNDGGTFTRVAYEGDPEFDEITEKSAYLPVGGELYNNTVPTLLSANGINAIHRLISQHYSYLSLEHANSEIDHSTSPMYGVIDAWKATPFSAALLKAQGLPCDELYFQKNPLPSAYEYIRDHLGYRLQALKTEGSFQGNTFRGKAVIRNVGFARPVNPRQVYLVLYNKKGVAYEIPTGIDARTFEPWKEVEIPLEGVLPAGAPKGKYKAALWLPDEEESIRYRTEYAVTLAEGTQRVDVGGRLLNAFK